MNFYILILNTSSPYSPADLHGFITHIEGIVSWWHYLDNTYIIKTTRDANFINGKIRTAAPNLLFLLTKVDLNVSTGYLPAEAWEWIKTENDNRVRLKVKPPQKIKISDLLAARNNQKLSALLRSNSDNQLNKPLFSPNLRSMKKMLEKK